MLQISEEEFLRLKNDSQLLQALRNGGVDNWVGWDYALEEYENSLDKED
jgi:ABC-type amino acid transport substrate-binding protein